MHPDPSALVGAIVALLANFDTLCERFCPPSPEPVPDLEAFLAVDYWRMTGAYEVPFFLLEGPNIARCDDPNALGINRANCDYSDDIGEVWRTELSDTLLVDDGLLDQSNIFSGLREIWFSSTGPEVVDAIYCSILSMDGGIELQLDPNRALSRETIETYLGSDIRSDRLYAPVSEPPDCTTEHSKSIGYLTLRLRNVTDSPITGLEITFRNFTASGPVGSDRDQNDLLLQSINSHNPSSFQDWLTSEENADVTGMIEAADESRSGLPDLLPGQSLLLPIYIFRANQTGFEDYFYRDWRLPYEISFRAENEQTTATVNFPRRDTAAVVRTFNGWYQQ